MSAADAARVGTGLAFVVMPLVFVFAFATHLGLLHPRVLRPEQLIDRARGKRLLHAGHGLVTVNTVLMIVVALHLGGIVTRHGAGWAGLLGTLLGARHRGACYGQGRPLSDDERSGWSQRSRVRGCQTRLVCDLREERASRLLPTLVLDGPG